MDHIGPFRRSERGNRYILVAIGYLSKWIIAKPVVNTSAALIRQFIQNDIINQHSYPHRMITDRGSGFRVKSLQTQLQKLGIEQSFSTTEHPQSNGQVERNNGSLLMAFKAYVNESHTNWDLNIPEATLAINTARHESSKNTPFEVVYGRRSEFPHERQFPWPSTRRIVNHRKFLRRILRFRQEVRKNLLKQQAAVKKRHDSNVRKTHKFKNGGLVLVTRT